MMNTIANDSIRATAAFYERSMGVKFFRTALAGVEWVAPALAPSIAQKLFLLPLPPKWLHRRLAWNPSWLIESVPFENTSLTLYRRLTSGSDGLSSAFEVDRQHVLITHGWGGSAEQMHTLGNAMADRGLVPIIVEMPGHGRSRGLASSMPQFARALQYVATHLTMNGVSIQAVVAHSLGASAAAFAVTRGLQAQRLVLIAPPDRPRDFTAMFAQVFGLSERTRARMQRRIEAQEAAHMDAFAARALAPALPMPTLVVHDEGDGVNPFAAAAHWVDRAPHGQLLATQGLGHRKILREKSTVEAIAQFAAQFD
jgi:pimeloyl-ACP methyl ester carboxylesterase